MYVFIYCVYVLLQAIFLHFLCPVVYFLCCLKMIYVCRCDNLCALVFMFVQFIIVISLSDSALKPCLLFLLYCAVAVTLVVASLEFYH
jgi:hypothetical protein